MNNQKPRITYNDSGKIDEIVGGKCHLEVVNDDTAFLEVDGMRFLITAVGIAGLASKLRVRLKIKGEY